MIKAVLFDFDGVLTTDATGSETICRYIAYHTGLDYLKLLGVYRQYNKDLLYGKATHAEIWESLCRRLDCEISIQLLFDSYSHTPIDSEMLDLVRKLKNNGYKTGMITDNKYDRIAYIAAQMNWGELFDVITVSACVGSGKGNQEIFLNAQQELALGFDECVFIDNNIKNLVVPSGLGMKTLYFDDEKRDYAALVRGLCAFGIDNLT